MWEWVGQPQRLGDEVFEPFRGNTKTAAHMRGLYAMAGSDSPGSDTQERDGSAAPVVLGRRADAVEGSMEVHKKPGEVRILQRETSPFARPEPKELATPGA